MPLIKVLTPEEGEALGIPRSRLVISFPPARPSQGSQKSSKPPSGSKTSPGTAITQAKLPEAPTQDQFASRDDYEEALVGSRSRVGRIKAMAGLKKKREERRDLRAAYLATDFEFEAEGQRYTLRVSEQNPQVRDLLVMHGAQGAAYITAYNPASLPLGEVHNTLAMLALRRDLIAANGGPWAVYEGAGQDRAGNWPPEPSLMVLGIGRSEAVKLGRKYGQYAIVWIDASGTPSLVELADLDRASRYPLKNPPFKWIELGFNWGCEWVGIRVSASNWRRILAGETIGLEANAKAWNGERFTRHWIFDGGSHLYVSYGDCGTAYDGRLAGATMRLP